MIGIDMEMPGSCAECPCGQNELWCSKTGSDFADDYCEIRLPDCPLIDLSRYEDDGK